MTIFRKIGIKLIIMVGLTAIIIIGVYSYLSIRAQSEVLLREIERHANQLSETVKNSTRYGMLLNQREYIHEICNTIDEQPTINDVRILNKVGEIIYSSKTDDIGKMVDKNAESCYACHAADKPLERLSIEERTRIFQLNPDDSRIMGIINPIYNEKSCWESDCHAHTPEQTVLGVLDITISLKDIDEQIKESEIKVAAFAFISILAISLIIGFFVKRWVDKPVNELVKATHRVAEGNWNYLINSNAEDEIGELAKSFNNMTNKLSDMRLQLFQSDKMASLGQLAAGVAHEINNPLTGILTYSSFLLKRSKNDPKLSEDLQVIVRETKRSREIVKGLLDFARQSTPKKVKADINEIIELAASVVSNQLKISHIRLNKKLTQNLPQLTADASQLQQVILNLLVNAIDAIPNSGGTITIENSLLVLDPYGITQIKNATCSKNHSLIDNDFKIEGIPSIKLKAKSNGVEGYVNLDPIYGKNRNHYGVPFSKNKWTELFCPECEVSLVDKNSHCPKCNSPIYKINIPFQGQLEGCTRFGCDWQKWGVIDQSGKKRFIEIKVTDTGCGIPKENLNKIFDPFFSTKGQKGTGLGLSVIWGIVDNHNGTIDVESEIGRGTTFIIKLPLQSQIINDSKSSETN